jgi:hypothetical protein
MPASKQFGIDAQIKGEVHQALKRLGAPHHEISIIAGDANPQQLYQTVKQLGATSDLLSILDSWGDPMDDEWVLNALQAWNRRVPPAVGTESLRLN